MANNNFNTKEFFSSAYFAPITLGEHTVTLGRVRAVIEENEGKDSSYILAPMTFSNGRKIDNRFYAIGAKIFCDQIRQQLEDATDYKKLPDFLRTLEGKEIKVWVSKRTYAATDGTPKTTLQYDFVAPVEVAEDSEETTEENPFG